MNRKLVGLKSPDYQAHLRSTAKKEASPIFFSTERIRERGSECIDQFMNKVEDPEFHPFRSLDVAKIFLNDPQLDTGIAERFSTLCLRALHLVGEDLPLKRIARELGGSSLAEKLGAVTRPKGGITLYNFLEDNLDYTKRNDYFELVKSYNRRFPEAEKEFRESKLPRLIAEAREEIYQKIDSKLLPISHDEVDSTIATLNFAVREHFPEELTMLDRGIFAEFDGSAELSVPTFADLSVVVHELYHALSGRVLLVHTTETGELAFIVRRLGLHTADRKFEWLNEAVTQDLTEETCPGSLITLIQAPLSQEIELYNLLRTKGNAEIPKSHFIEAYFEDQTDPIDEEIGTRKYKRLLAAVNNAYPQGEQNSRKTFLHTLEEHIEANGIENTIQVFTENDAQEINRIIRNSSVK